MCPHMCMSCACMRVCVSMCLCVCVCMRVCVCMSVCVCVCTCVCGYVDKWLNHVTMYLSTWHPTILMGTQLNVKLRREISPQAQ